MHQRNDALRALPFFFYPQHVAIRVAHAWQPIRHVDLDSDYDGQQPCCLALRRWTQHVDLHCKVFANHVDVDRDGQQTMLPWTAVVNTPRWLALDSETNHVDMYCDQLPLSWPAFGREKLYRLACLSPKGYMLMSNWPVGSSFAVSKVIFHIYSKMATKLTYQWQN